MSKLTLTDRQDNSCTNITSRILTAHNLCPMQIIIPALAASSDAYSACIAEAVAPWSPTRYSEWASSESLLPLSWTSCGEVPCMGWLLPYSIVMSAISWQRRILICSPKGAHGCEFLIYIHILCLIMVQPCQKLTSTSTRRFRGHCSLLRTSVSNVWRQNEEFALLLQ